MQTYSSDRPGLTRAAVVMWPTPAAEHHGPDRQRRDTGNPNSNLETAVTLWPTPHARDVKGANQEELTERGTKAPPLNEVAVLWRTPQAMDAERGSNGTWTPYPKAGEHSLRHQIEHWKTPRVERGGYTRDKGDPEKQRPTIDGQAAAFSLPVLATYPVGPPPSSDRRSLNPAFRRVADGLASRLDIARVDRLRLLGNGVVSLEAAYAIRTLATRLAASGSAGATQLVRLMEIPER